MTGTSINFKVPEDPTKLPAGVYALSVLFTNGSGQVIQSTNSLPMALAPRILAAPPPTVVTNTQGPLVTLHCDPQALPNQNVYLALGATSVPAQTFDLPAPVLSFQFPKLTPGSYLARLRVDGVDSPVAVNFAVNPPVFTGPFITV